MLDFFQEGTEDEWGAHEDLEDEEIHPKPSPTPSRAVAPSQAPGIDWTALVPYRSPAAPSMRDESRQPSSAPLSDDLLEPTCAMTAIHFQTPEHQQNAPAALRSTWSVTSRRRLEITQPQEAEMSPVAIEDDSLPELSDDDLLQNALAADALPAGTQGPHCIWISPWCSQ